MADIDLSVLEKIKFSNDGYMLESDSWTPEIAEAIAEVLHISLTQDHWKIINFSREIYLEEEKNVSVRRLMKDLGVQYQDVFDLFPGLPVRTIAKIAGLPKPVGCV